MRKTDYASRDAIPHVAFLGQVQTRRGYSREACLRYFRDVHGIIGARSPYFYRYWQHQYERASGGVFPKLDGIEYECAEADQIDAIAHVFHRSADERISAKQRGSRTVDLIGLDEQNPFESTFIYFANEGNSITYVDGIEDSIHSGPQSLIKFFVWVKKNHDVSDTDFREYMAKTFAPAFAGSNLVLKLRLNLFEPYDNEAWTTPNVNHYRAPEQQYQACFEIAFQNRLEMKQLFVSPEYSATEEDQPQYIRALHAFPERAMYSYVYDGELTPVGKRGYPAIELIEQFGAFKQLEDEVTDLVAPPHRFGEER